MICHYANCRAAAIWTPVVELPTIEQVADGSWRAADRPTYLIGHEVCQSHRNNYMLSDWISEAEWNLVRDAAESKGFNISALSLIQVTFKPLGWTPDQSYIEVKR